MSDITLADILEMLPHRYPFLLIDRVLEWLDELVQRARGAVGA